MIDKIKKIAKESTLRVGKYKVGVPVVSDSYKSKTPRPIKIIGEGFILAGSAVAIIAASFSPPGWVIAAGGIATLAGRFIAKCFS